jgi:hypothetical protein
MAQPVDDLDLGLPDNRLCEGVALAVADREFDPGCGRALAWRIDTYRRQSLRPVVNPATQILRDVSYQSSPGGLSRAGPLHPVPAGPVLASAHHPSRARPLCQNADRLLLLLAMS